MILWLTDDDENPISHIEHAEIGVTTHSADGGNCQLGLTPKLRQRIIDMFHMGYSISEKKSVESTPFKVGDLTVKLPIVDKAKVLPFKQK